MYLDNTWYALKVLPQYKNADPVKGLDVSILQDQPLGPVLGIGDPRTDKRIDFIGGIRGLKELERRVSEDMEIAFPCIQLPLKSFSSSRRRPFNAA